MRPRDSRGRFIKVHSDIFGNRNPPLTNPRDRNTSNEIENNNAQISVELGTTSARTEGIISEQLHAVETPQTQQTSPSKGDSNLVDTVNIERINSLLGQAQNPVVSQVESTTDLPFNLQSWPRPDHWDFIPSPRRDRLGVNWFRNPLVMSDQETRHQMEGEGEHEVRTETTFGFPILDLARNVNMKNIPASSLPTFYGKSTEDPDTFLFEFDILCRSYNYLQDAQKLKLFPATLKDSALRWFMSLGESTI